MKLIRASQPGFEAVLDGDMNWVRSYGPIEGLAELKEATELIPAPYNQFPLMVGLEAMADSLRSLVLMDVEVIFQPGLDDAADTFPGRVY